MAIRRPQIKIDKIMLIKTFKKFKERSNKVFVVSELARNSGNKYKKFREKYLNTLISLGLIEEVDAAYKTGSKNKIGIKGVKGYKIKHNLENGRG